ncbi:metallophosphoesterase [Echinicola jeungdonensis]|uniref:Metallophosphoesterase n=1 Tax=Echinicola jeungdonensis TaxID=709343 RepID=A0ABV5J2Y7_9BACT|nr:metallophosphoesterase [Echinicola jeungdonensis]MDN3668390.1 metallophosphoesterase [Echinicola jeungdonensis]
MGLFFFMALVIFLACLFIDIDYKDNKKGIQRFKWIGISHISEDNPFEIIINKRISLDLDGIDGPYIIDDQLYKVNLQNGLVAQIIADRDSILVEVDNSDNDFFVVGLKDHYPKEACRYESPRKLVAISDIEGNFDAFYGFLVNNKIMDTSYNWTLGEGHLILLGDFVNRGKNVTQTLWLIYLLEEKARKENGKVHFILGNQEAIKLQGTPINLSDRYLRVAQEISQVRDWDKASKYVFSKASELGNWLRSKNAIEIIGDYLFVHGGISPELASLQLPLEEINQYTQENLDLPKKSLEALKNPTVKLVLGPKGPLNYRGFIMGYKNYKKASQKEIDHILNLLKVKKIVIGHIFVDDISKDYRNKIIRINVPHGMGKNSPQTKGLLIEDGMEYKINGKGEKERI